MAIKQLNICGRCLEMLRRFDAGTAHYTHSLGHISNVPMSTLAFPLRENSLVRGANWFGAYLLPDVDVEPMEVHKSRVELDRQSTTPPSPCHRVRSVVETLF